MHNLRWNLCEPTLFILFGTVIHVLSPWFTCCFGQLTPDEKQTFAKFNIYPEITMLPPLNILKVSYHYKNVETGNYLQTYEITDPPVFLQWPREIGAYCILFLLGSHRLVFTVFKQPGKIHYEKDFIPNTFISCAPANFSTRKFAEDYDLGEPYAGNFFVVNMNDSILVPDHQDQENYY
ncbi:protein D1 isoform X1 [Bemisia tabaci]|uniref:protein D1 isoform X1 n=1 Tax=Bemisia tabaci TaxID=7038 RepID=UPI003B28C78A